MPEDYLLMSTKSEVIAVLSLSVLFIVVVFGIRHYTSTDNEDLDEFLRMAKQSSAKCFSETSSRYLLAKWDPEINQKDIQEPLIPTSCAS